MAQWVSRTRWAVPTAQGSRAGSQKASSEASSAPQLRIAGSAIQPLCEGHRYCKVHAFLPGETEKNVQAEIMIVSDEGEKQKRGNDTLLWDSTVIHTERFFLWNEAQNVCLSI